MRDEASSKSSSTLRYFVSTTWYSLAQLALLFFSFPLSRVADSTELSSWLLFFLFLGVTWSCYIHPSLKQSLCQTKSHLFDIHRCQVCVEDDVMAVSWCVTKNPHLHWGGGGYNLQWKKWNWEKYLVPKTCPVKQSQAAKLSNEKYHSQYKSEEKMMGLLNLAQRWSQLEEELNTYRYHTDLMEGT